MNQQRILQVLCINMMLFSFTASGQSLPRLKVSNNHHYLVMDDGTQEGKPFFYLGDTAWELFTRLTKSEVEKYFQVRKEQGFNVIIAISHNELGEKSSSVSGINYPNREGFTPFKDQDHAFLPEGIQEEYWTHVDWVIKEAGKNGLYIAFLPYWGNRYAQRERTFLINNADLAYNWGYFSGKRYKDEPNIIWVLGGDCEPWDYKTKKFDEDEYIIPIAVAEGIADGINGAKKQFDDGKADYSKSLMTYHINVPRSSSEYFHDADFLDFNSMQSGQNVEGFAQNYLIVAKDYARKPVKPTIDMEPLYEFGMRRNGRTNQWEYPRCTAFDVRRNAYRSILAGAMGFNYGNNNVWLFFRRNTNYEDKYQHTNDWDSKEGIYSDGAQQLIWAKNLFASRPAYKCIPAPDLISDTVINNIIETHIQPTLAEDKSFALFYIPTGQVFNVDITRVNGNVDCWWFDPVTGAICDQTGKAINAKKPFQTISQKEKTRNFQFSSPTNQDWVLVIDDDSKKLPVPGTMD